MSERDIRQIRATYFGLIAQADAGIGRVIQHLKETGEYDDTLIVVVNVDPHSARECTVSLNLEALGLSGEDWNEDGTFWVDDLITGQSW